MSEKYNGWTNYETWCVNLWMKNDQSSDTYYRELAATTYDDAAPVHGLSRREIASITLAELLKFQIKEQVPELDGMYADLLNASISAVNWHELATALLEGVGDTVSPDVS